MSWPNFLTPAWAFLGLIAVPIVLLYILRQRRPDLPISSTFLWSKALADMRASTPWQKLRNNLLLFLQLLILAALVFTLMRPVIQAQASQASAGVIVIDATASMQTRDGGADESRLDRAKAEAKKLIDAMRPGDKFMLIADGGGMTQIRSGFSDSKSELKSLIDQIKPSDTPSDLSESLLLAATSLRAIGARPEAGAAPITKTENIAAGKVWLFSDGAGVKVPAALGGDEGQSDALQFIKIGSSDKSVGITRVSITPVPKAPRTYQVFVGIKNAGSEKKHVGVLLAYGSKDNFLPDQAKFADLAPNDSTAVTFEKVIADPGKLFIRADDTDDDFPLDNTAYAIIEPPRKVKIALVTRGNQLLENFVNTVKKVGLAEGQIIDPASYDPAFPADLFILDGFLPPPDKLPKADTLIFRPDVPAAPGGGAVDVAGFRVSQVIDSPPILSWKREEPIMRYVELGDLHVYHSLLLDRDSSAVDLLTSTGGPLMAYKDFGSVRRYLVGFSPLLDSDWWHLPSLVILVQNIVEQTGERHFIGIPQMLPAGSPAKLWNVGDDNGGGKATVTLPDGSVGEVAVKDGTAEFGQTDHLGFYEVQGAKKDQKALFAVNLLSTAESDIRPRSLQTAAGNDVQEAPSVTMVNKEIWRWVALAALVFLLLEWWAYHRRVT